MNILNDVNIPSVGGAFDLISPFTPVKSFEPNSVNEFQVNSLQYYFVTNLSKLELYNPGVGQWDLIKNFTTGLSGLYNPPFVGWIVVGIGTSGTGMPAYMVWYHSVLGDNAQGTWTGDMTEGYNGLLRLTFSSAGGKMWAV